MHSSLLHRLEDAAPHQQHGAGVHDWVSTLAAPPPGLSLRTAFAISRKTAAHRPSFRKAS
jgi:hypothetical protein